MKNLCAALTLLTFLVVGVGVYRGWFALLRPVPDAVSGKVNITLTTDTGKLKHDVQTVKDKATELTGGVTDDIDIVTTNNP